MSNLEPNDPPMSQQKFKGLTSAKQKQEIRRLAGLLGEEPTISSSATKREQQVYYEQLTGMYNAREAGANSPPQPPSPTDDPWNAPPQQPPELNLNAGPITPDEFDNIPPGRPGTEARKQAWATLLEGNRKFWTTK